MTNADASRNRSQSINPGDSVEYLLEVRGVRKTFQVGKRAVKALRGVDLRARRGEITGLIGPDGAGKTTLIRMIAGLLAPDEGSILVAGRDASRASSDVQEIVGYMPQRFGLYEDLTVDENLDLYADLQLVPHKARPARYAELTQMTGLAPFGRRLAGRLSGGMKQKLGLACALMRSPELLLLDEPTVGVDPVSRRELWAIINRLVRDEGVSVFVSTLYLDEAEHCNEVVILHEGESLGQDSPSVFSETMRGGTWSIATRGAKPRSIQARAARVEGVIDAVIQGDSVRVVLDDKRSADPARALAAFEGASIERVNPRFEDAFMRMMSLKNPLVTTVRTAETSRQTRDESASTAAEAVIEVRDARRRFGDFYAVKGVTFDVRRGEVFGLLGANGAGKSTTFRMLCGLLPASSGSLRVAGIDARRAAAAARARLGYMSQRFSLSGNLTVKQNLNFFGGAYGLWGRRRAARIDWALREFELLDYVDTMSATLPLGFKQRLALGCSLLHEPSILFLDEPTSGVDPAARREFWRRINELSERNVTVLVTTHFMEEAEYCDRLAVMAAGAILALGSPAEIRRLGGAADRPALTMEEAFINLIEQSPTNGGAS